MSHPSIVVAGDVCIEYVGGLPADLTALGLSIVGLD